MTAHRITVVLLVAYLIGVVVAFGPASVEEDHTEAARRVECLTLKTPESVMTCQAWARNDFTPILKAWCWPLWLSRRIARGEPE